MRLLMYIFILCLTIWAGFFLHKNPGNLELAYQDWVIDMPLWLPIIGGIICLFLLTLIFVFFASINRLFKRFKEWLLGASMRSMLQNTSEARIAMIEGDWSHAESKMLKAVKNSDAPLHCYLVAAKAAQELGAIDRRDGYLHQALRVAPDAKIAVLLTQAELQYEQGQFEHCAVTMQELQKISPHNRQVLKLASSVYATIGAWEDMAHLLPQLNKYMILPPEDFIALEIKTYIYLLRTETKKTGKEGLIAYRDMCVRMLRLLKPMLSYS